MERLDRIDKPNRKPNFTLSDDGTSTNCSATAASGGKKESTTRAATQPSPSTSVTSSGRAGDCVIAYKRGTDESVVVRITLRRWRRPPSAPKCSGE